MIGRGAVGPCRGRPASGPKTFARSVAVVLVLATAGASPTAAAPPCSTPGSGWCVARRFAGDVPAGELGFRFGEPLDVDGDGRADVAAGSRFKLRENRQAGRAAVWSGANGALIRAWDGVAQDGLFGHWVLPVPDLDGDELADLLIAAPSLVVDGTMRGVVVARSPASGKEIWRRTGNPNANFGWDLAPAGDHDGDGRIDVFVGQPAMTGGRVYLLSGRDGSVLRTYAPHTPMTSFGWFVAQVDDLDGDARGELAVGARPQNGRGDPPGGAAYVVSSASGRELHQWRGTDSRRTFGEVVAGLGDVDGDGRGEIIVASPGTIDRARHFPGEVRVYSGATGASLRRWSGTQPGELYGRIVVAVGDLDADGVDDLAIGAPWHRRETGDRVGRVEIRSGRSGRVLHELYGDGPESWFGWHIRRAPDPEDRGRPTLLIGSLRQSVDGLDEVGVLDLYVRRGDTPPAPQGIITRDSRRSDIK